MGTKQNHDFHILEPSPWPITLSFGLMFFVLGIALIFHNHHIGYIFSPLGFITLILTLWCWWKDVIKEARVDKAHTEVVKHGLRIAVALFILSEIAFFFTFFWSFFRAWLDPVMLLRDFWPEGQSSWPPKGIHTFDPWDIPFINTLILLLSGTTVTWAHYALEDNKRDELVTALGLSVCLGVVFTLFQAYEYHHAHFKLIDGIYPSNFYLATGFHGLHVIVGTIFLAVCFFRARLGHFDKGNAHLGVEFAAWYWHFVDVVWLFLFVFVYVLAR
ncbi:MAG: cytochrome c oxidase subunit 3 [Rickettsiaceae bacterium]|nr:cytochrome c oxidase subunit 3 [Rickettsiaceae bacterium]